MATATVSYQMVVKGVKVNTATGRVMVRGEYITISKAELAVLVLLMRNMGRVVEFERIARAIGRTATELQARRCAERIRNKLRVPCFIRCVDSVGCIIDDDDVNIDSVIDVDLKTGRVQINGVAMTLSSMQCKMLSMLHAAAREVVPHVSLFNQIWGVEKNKLDDADYNNLNRLAMRLRKNLRESGVADIAQIECQLSRGYRLVVVRKPD